MHKRAAAITLLGCIAALAGCMPVRSYPRVEVTPTAEKHFMAGRDLYRREDFEGAMKELRAAVAVCPRHVQAHRLYQDASVAVRRIEPLLDEYEDLRSAPPRAPLYEYLCGRLEITDKNQQRAFRRALRENRNFPWAWYGLGAVAHRQRDLSAAERYYKRAVTASDGRLVEPLVGLGKIYGLKGKYAKAREVLERAAKVDPLDPLPHIVMAVVYRNLRHHAQAIAECERAIGRMPNCRPALYLCRDLIEKHPKAADLGQARECLQGALKGFPDHPDLLATLGLVEMLDGNTDAALGHFEKAKANGLCPADYANPMRLLYVRKGKYDRALRVWREKVPEQLTDGAENILADRFRALSQATVEAARRGDDPQALLRLARAYAGAGWVDEAESVADRIAPKLDAAAALRDRVKKNIELCGRIEQLFREDYVRFQTKQRCRSVAKVLREIEKLATDVTGQAFEGETQATDYPFLGKVTGHRYPPRDDLMKYFDEFNQLLIVGKPSGSAPVECGLMTLISRQPRRTSLLWGAPVASDRVLVDDFKVSGYHETLESRRTGGQAIDGFFYTNVNAVWRWCTDDIRVFKRLWRGDVPRRELAPELIDRMSSQPTRLLDRVYREECGGSQSAYFLKALDLVDCHELGHVADARTHLPIMKHLFRDLFLMIECGFSPVNVLAYTERNAELTAMAHAQSPRLVLGSMTGYLETGFDDSPHSKGYRRIIERMVDDIERRPHAYREIDTRRRIIDQLTALPLPKIRSFARRLAEEWKIPRRVREASGSPK